MTKILITGAGGFVGTYLIKELQKSPENEIFGAVFSATSDVSSLLPSDHVIEGDLSNYDFAKNLVSKSMPDVIYHLAALSVVGTSEAKALSVINTNTTISYNLLEAVKNITPAARFVAIASANVYGAVIDSSKPINESTPIRPLNPYAVSKVSQEMLATMYHLAYGLDVVIVRPFNHTGVGQTTDFVVPKLAEQFARIENGELESVIEVGNLDTVRDFTDVRDMVVAYILAAKSGKSGEIYNIGSGTGHSISDIINILQSLSTAKVEIKVKEELVRKSDVPILVCEVAKFKSICSWTPKISINQTLSDILNYYRGN